MYSSVFQKILDILYPRFCYVCKKPLNETQNFYLCFSCWRKIPLIRHEACLQCGMPVGKGIETTKVCLVCQKEKFAFSQARCAGEYNDSLRELLLSFKFHGITQLRFPLGALLYWKIKNTPFPQKPQIIVPVPMSYSSQIQRGYNQAVLLAENLSHRLKIPCFPHLLEKIKTTKPQSELQRQERKKNLVSCFRIEGDYYKKQCKDKIVLLVDDILTTGNTASECSKVLTQAGAQKVYVATVARTLNF